ncbi:MAG TPA: calcium-binding protein [Rhizobiaceae bacterium]|nr:calcium-binding protein [Rhizobiaceae bacterium]
MPDFHDSVGPGIRFTVNACDELSLPPGALVHSTDSNAFFVNGAGARIESSFGTTISTAGTVAIQTTNVAHNFGLHIFGTVRSSHENGKAVVLSGSGNTILIDKGVENGATLAGSIFASSIAIWLNGAVGNSTSTVINKGNIYANTAVQNDGSERAVFTNEGFVFADGVGAGQGAFVDFAGTNDIVTNTGTMYGNIFLGGGNDRFSTANGSFSGYVYGGDGNDTIIAGIGGDEFDGQNGNDTLTGNRGVDQIKGGAGNDTVTGGAGDDRLYGDANNDKLNGGVGTDRLWGGANADTFIFNVAPTIANCDFIYDFNRVDDTIQLENAVFKQIGAVGPLKATAFKLSTQVKDADDRIIYNRATGQIFYDADGSGPIAPANFVSLTTKPLITAADFHVI